MDVMVVDPATVAYLFALFPGIRIYVAIAIGLLVLALVLLWRIDALRVPRTAAILTVMYFVLGPIPGVANAFVGVGWRGTGYKFAPWVGRVLTDLALADGTQYDIDRFDPARFEEGGSHEQAVAEDTAGTPR